MSRKPRLLLSRQALADNYQRLSSFSGQAECAASIKANAYGVGIEFAAPVLWEAGCRTYFVAYLEEALALRSLLPDAVIYAFHGYMPDEFSVARDKNIRPVINTSDEAMTQGIASLRPALHIDTGMRRLGIPHDEFERLPELMECCQPSLLMSHLASADESGSSQSQQQLAQFESVRDALGSRCPPSSLANTAGILLGENYQFDLVRPGIGLYGGSPDPMDPKGFQPVVTWQAQILELQQVKPGETVGYGASFVAQHQMQLATIGVGYADGYQRVLSGRGEVAIDGECCPVVGRVSMDLVTIDVSRLSGHRVGSWVEIMGPTISIDTLATKANTIGYEFLTRLGSRMERTIV